MDQYSNASLLILGYGREGKAALSYLSKRYPNATIAVADKAEHLDFDDANQEQKAQQWLLGSAYPHTLTDWDVVIVSPGIPPHDPLLQSARFVTTATNIFLQDCKGEVIVVTGSKGKSTTASLIAHILDVSLVGNIGNPGLAALLQKNDEKTFFVYEMSSYQARLLDRSASVVVITSLFPEHIDYHGSVEQYYQDKLKVATKQEKNDSLFFNAQNKELVNRLQNLKSTAHPWPSDDIFVDASGTIFVDHTIPLMHKDDIPLLGAHNVSNVLGAISVAMHYDVDISTIAEKIRSFVPLRHRLERVGTFEDITFYNDSISTTPESTLAALEALPQTATIFLGGTDRGYDFTKLASQLQKMELQNIVFFPESGKRIADACEKIGYHPRMLYTRSMKEAVDFAYRHTPQKSVCLLSCAAPSYTLYKNFEERGDDFTEEIKKYHASKKN